MKSLRSISISTIVEQWQNENKTDWTVKLKSLIIVLMTDEERS